MVLCLFVLSFFPLDVLDEIWDVIESVSEGFLTFSCVIENQAHCSYSSGYLSIFLSFLDKFVSHFPRH